MPRYLVFRRFSIRSSHIVELPAIYIPSPPRVADLRSSFLLSLRRVTIPLSWSSYIFFSRLFLFVLPLLLSATEIYMRCLSFHFFGDFSFLILYNASSWGYSTLYFVCFAYFVPLSSFMNLRYSYLTHFRAFNVSCCSFTKLFSLTLFRIFLCRIFVVTSLLLYPRRSPSRSSLPVLPPSAVPLSFIPLAAHESGRGVVAE